MKVCVVQMNYRVENIQRHVERIKNLIRDYRTRDLIVFPELILHGHPSYERPEGFLYRKMKVIYNSVSQDIYRHIKEVGARVIIGESKRWGDRYYNVATYVDEETTQSYTKTHVHWTENFVPGRKLVVFESPLGKIGITICFDAAFSEVWRVLALKGAEVVVNISAVPTTFPVEYVWRRMRGAAIFNQVFVIYANRPGAFFSGHSAVFDPRGEKVVSAGSEEAVIEADIHLEELRRWRDEEVIFPNRRPLLYRAIGVRHQEDLELEPGPASPGFFSRGDAETQRA